MAIGHESIGKRLWGAVRPSLGTVILYIVYTNRPLPIFLRFYISFADFDDHVAALYGRWTRHDFLDHLTEFWEESLIVSEDLGQEEVWGGLCGAGYPSRGAFFHEQWMK